MKFIDFFAGIGGFRFGLELAGHKCVGFCEADKYATASYIVMHCMTDEQREELVREYPDQKKRLKHVLAHKEEYLNGEWYSDDIRTVEEMPYADLFCAGFPCQDISVAGKQAGLDGERSGLFFAVTDIIRKMPEENRPKYLLFENVKNLLSINKGKDFLRILSELDEIGYDAEWNLIDSADYIPQHRERVFLVGHLRGYGNGLKVFPLSSATGEDHLGEEPGEVG